MHGKQVVEVAQLILSVCDRCQLLSTYLGRVIASYFMRIILSACSMMTERMFKP